MINLISSIIVKNNDLILALGPVAVAGLAALAQMAYGAVNSMVQGGITGGLSEKETKRQYIWTKRRDSYLHDWQISDRNEQRLYDHPLNERNRWTMAGYNPQSVFGNFSQSAPVAFSGSSPIHSQGNINPSPIDVAEIAQLKSKLDLEKAEKEHIEAETDAIRGTEKRNEDMHDYNKRYQDALATLTADRNKREEVEQQMQSEMDAATRNKMQADIDSAVEALRLQDEKQKEDARHNLKIEALAAYEAETNRQNAVTNAMNAITNRNKVNAEIGEIKERTKALQRENYINFGVDAINVPIPKLYAKQLPYNLKPYVVKTSSGSYNFVLKYDELANIEDAARTRLFNDIRRVDIMVSKKVAPISIMQAYLKAFTNFQEASNAVGLDAGASRRASKVK